MFTSEARVIALTAESIRISSASGVAFAFRTACLSEPSPLSASVVTVNVAAPAGRAIRQTSSRRAPLKNFGFLDI